MYKNIDLKKYKRIFAFGCSFTAYRWPTWADIIAVEANTEYYNYGLAGLGNLGIMCKISEANAMHKFNEDDLVMVLWSTYSREDRWFNGSWYPMGNVWNSPYPDSWVKEYCDPLGHLIRDHAIISQTNRMLKDSKSDSIILRSVPFKHSDAMGIDDVDRMTILSHLYQRDYDELPMSLYDFIGCDWSRDVVPYIDNGNMHNDSHCKPIVYYNFLEASGLNLSESTYDYAYTATQSLLHCKTNKEISLMFEQPVRDLLTKNFKPLL